ncbi:DUF5368 domain-containing protein [Phreatobacter sp. HK31-P]
MKDLDISVFIAVFQEMLGPALWLLVAIAILGILAFLFLLVRDRGLFSRRLIGAEVLGVFGGVLALFIMWFVTDSNLYDVGGPIDWVLVAVIWTVGAIGSAILAYVALAYLDWGGARRPAA